MPYMAWDRPYMANIVEGLVAIHGSVRPYMAAGVGGPVAIYGPSRPYMAEQSGAQIPYMYPRGTPPRMGSTAPRCPGPAPVRCMP